MATTIGPALPGQLFFFFLSSWSGAAVPVVPPRAGPTLHALVSFSDRTNSFTLIEFNGRNVLTWSQSHRVSDLDESCMQTQEGVTKGGGIAELTRQGRAFRGKEKITHTKSQKIKHLTLFYYLRSTQSSGSTVQPCSLPLALSLVASWKELFYFNVGRPFFFTDDSYWCEQYNLRMI